MVLEMGFLILLVIPYCLYCSSFLADCGDYDSNDRGNILKLILKTQKLASLPCYKCLAKEVRFTKVGAVG